VTNDARPATLERTTSRDGTPIGWYRRGHGPPLLLVHGGLGDHHRWDALRPHLEPYVTVHAMDRRGRGASGDHPVYSLARECEDVAAVVDAIAAASGTTVDVYGHSYGGACAFGAARLTQHLGRLVLYEGWPPVDPSAWVPPADLLARLESSLAEGDRETVLETFLREAVRMTDEELDVYRRHPSWAARVAAAHTILREERAFPTVAFDAAQAALVTVPTLLLVGEVQTLDWQVATVADHLPDARVEVLPGQAHTADLLAPGLVADRLLAFLDRRRG
jgi:pimeloyl-ACP methyl ester carboxylesterase